MSLTVFFKSIILGLLAIIRWQGITRFFKLIRVPFRPAISYSKTALKYYNFLVHPATFLKQFKPLYRMETILHFNKNYNAPQHWHSLLLTTLLLFAFGNAKAQTQQCPSNNEYTLYGYASFHTDGSIQLTPDFASRAGQAWSKKIIDLNYPFSQTFRLHAGWNEAGGDGLAFVMRGPSTASVGTSGFGMGYQTISPSLAFEFDTYNNGTLPNYADLVNDHFALHKGGSPYLTGRIGNAVDLGNIENNVWHAVTIDWVPSTKTLTVTFDYSVIYTVVRDIVALDFGGNPNVIIGFTASTGAFFNPQQVCIQDLVYTPCSSGLVAPTLAAGAVTTACPIKTTNLNSRVTSTVPAGAGLVWFTNNAHTGTQVSTPTAAGPGTYYGFYRDLINSSCYSPASAAVTVSSTSSICSDLSLTAIPNLSNKAKGEKITYTCTLSNAGPDAAPNTKVQVKIPENTTLLTAIPSQGTFVQGNNVWEAGTVANGANLTITVTVVVD